MSQEVISFLLRFVHEVEEGEARWRGVIRHVQGDDERHFSHFADALAFIQEHMARMVQTAVDGEGQRPLLETSLFWGDLTPGTVRPAQDGNEQLTAEEIAQTITAVLAKWETATALERQQVLLALQDLVRRVRG